MTNANVSEISPFAQYMAYKHFSPLFIFLFLLFLFCLVYNSQIVYKAIYHNYT